MSRTGRWTSSASWCPWKAPRRPRRGRSPRRRARRSRATISAAAAACCCWITTARSQRSSPSRASRGRAPNCSSFCAAAPRNDIALLSGRSRATVEDWFGALPIGLVAEHGAWMKEAGKTWGLIKPVSAAWETQLLTMLKSYADRVPGPFVEEKEFSIVWHYRNAASERGALAASELSDDLLAFTANINVQVVQANKSVEVRAAGVHKGVAAAQWLAKGGYDFVLAVGDDRSDEDTFGILPDRAYSIRVGERPTRARFSVRGPAEVLDLVSRLAERGEREALMPPSDRPIYH